MLGGGLPPGCPTPDPISDQKMSFFTPVFRPGLNQYPFSDLACKKLRHRYLDYNSNKKDFLKSMSKSRISLSVLLIWNGNIKTFVHSRSSLENHTLFQTKMNKVCTRFHTETAQKPYPLGWHIPIWLISIGEFLHPPPPPPLHGWRRAMSAVFSGLCFKSLVSRRAVAKGRESVISSGYCEYDWRVFL